VRNLKIPTTTVIKRKAEFSLFPYAGQFVVPLYEVREELEKIEPKLN